jgi:ABC-2 type transport system ATP-binding protein
VIILEGVSKTFRHRPLFRWLGGERSGETCALKDVSLHVTSGTVHVLLGPNGSGKTTLLKLVSTMLLPDRGRVLVAGWNTRTHAAQVRKMVGFALSTERSFFPRLTARENLIFFATMDDVPRRERAGRVDDLLSLVGLASESGMLVMKFSTGMYQRLGIARALLKRPSVILLDEATRSLDPASATHLRRIIRDLADSGATVLLATHSFQEAIFLGDEVSILHRGAVAATRPLQGLTKDELRAFYFGLIGEPDEEADCAPGMREDYGCAV